MMEIKKHVWKRIVILSLFTLFFTSSCITREYADFVIINGKIVTVDQDFDIAEAMAVKGDSILAVGSAKMINRYIGNQTKVIDAGGRTVLPGLIEGHLHPQSASLSELTDEIPDVHTIQALLDWITDQAGKKADGEWIIFPKFFYTRLLDMRPPTLKELDSVAPDNPVFLDGSYGGVINTAAMRISGITSATRHQGLIRDKHTGRLTGLLKRSAFELLKIPTSDRYSDKEKEEALVNMLKRYNSYGITSVCEGAGNANSRKLYQELENHGDLTARVFINILLPLFSGQNKDTLVDEVKNLDFKTGDGDKWVRIGALKVILDGGILTGTAYLREPWGARAAKIYGIEDPSYRGVINYSYDDLVPIVKTAAGLGWKFTAHCTGGGGVDRLLDVYEEVNRTYPVKDLRFSIIHGNFFTPDAIERMKKLGVYADMQAAWFYKDADAMKYILGDERIKTFMPYRSLMDAGVMVNGGSDHMVKFDADKSINPYNPFLAMWTMVTRTTENGNVVVPEEAVSRQEALKTYTINNAWGSFEESIKGSLEAGKLADIAILSDDILTCPVDRIRDIKAELTIVGGKIVYSSGAIESK